MKLDLKKIYFAMFFILFFISFNITIYGYFIPSYIILGIGLFLMLIVFLMEIKNKKIKKNNLLYTFILFVISFIYVFRNQQLSTNFFSNCTYLFALFLLFILQFSDRWFDIPYKVIKIFAIEHLIGTYFVLLLPNLYKNLILPIFKLSSGYNDLLNQVNYNMIAGFTGNYGTNAIYLTLSFLVLFTIFINTKKHKKSDLILLILLYFGIILTGKRGPLIFGTLSVIIVYLFVYKEKILKKVLKLSIVGILLVLLMIIASNFIPNIALVYDRIFNSVNILNGREKLYELALLIFNEHTFFGIGWGNFKYYYSLYYNVTEQLNVHNIYLQLLCEIGIFGTFIILFFMFYSLRKTSLMLKNNKYKKYFIELSISFCIQIFILLIGISSTPLYGIESLYIYIVSCALPYTISFNSLGDEKNG